MSDLSVLTCACGWIFCTDYDGDDETEALGVAVREHQQRHHCKHPNLVFGHKREHYEKYRHLIPAAALKAQHRAFDRSSRT